MNPILPLFLATTLLAATSAQAMNLRFMKDSALGRLKASDLESLRTQVNDALADAPDGEVIEWTAPDGGVSASILLRASYNQDGETRCRRTLMKVRQGSAPAERYRFDLCQQGEIWQFTQTPISLFTRDDWDYVDRVSREALNNEPDGSPVSWFQRASRNSGVVTPLSTFEHEGRQCRRLAISIISHQGHTSDATFNACRQDGGDWQRVIIDGE